MTQEEMSPFPGYINIKHITYTKKWDITTHTFDEYLDNITAYFREQAKQFYLGIPCESMAIESAQNLVKDAILAGKLMQESCNEYYSK